MVSNALNGIVLFSRLARFLDIVADHESGDILPTLTLWNAGLPTSQLSIPAPRHLSRS
jgi:hypothetical protein